MNIDNSSSIAIIGGADGPTAIFISGNPTFRIIAFILIILLIAIVLYLFLKKKSDK